MELKNYNNTHMIKFINIGSPTLANYFNINEYVKQILNDYPDLTYSNLIFKVTFNTHPYYLNILNLTSKYPHSVKLYNYLSTNSNDVHEIIKKYNWGLVDLVGKLNGNQIKKIIQYLILIQLEMFDKYGFVWKNLAQTNIFIQKQNLIETIEFNYNGKSQLIKTNTKLFISDFEHCIILNPTFGFVKNYLENKLINTNESNSLVFKLYDCFIIGLELFSNKKIIRDFKIKTLDIKHVCYNKSNKFFNNYKTYLMDNIELPDLWIEQFNIFKSKELSTCEMLLSYCWKAFDEIIKKIEK